MEFSPSFILGAGFSRAIHQAMPTIGDLGALVLEKLDLSSTTLAPFGGDLERWMSFLSADQPWLADGENLRNRGLFLEAAAAVDDTIEDAERQVINQPVPIWLTRLVWSWCEQKADIFTFNYDTLIERCLSQLGRVSTLGDVYAAPLVERLPLGTHLMFASASPRGDVLRLFKLHGSTNWGFGGIHGPASDPIVLTDERLAWALPALDEIPPPPRWTTRFDDLYPLIVPPTFSKGPYYSNSTLRGQWRRGATTLASTSEMTIIGYSFPPGDLTTREWISTSLSAGASVRIVDLNPEVAGRIAAEFAQGHAVSDETGDNAIPRYVERNCGDHVEWEIEEEDNNPPARISLKVNGNEQLSQDPVDRLWEPGLEEAQRWLHTRIEAAAPQIIDRSISRSTGGLIREHREVVLPLGATIKL